MRRLGEDGCPSTADKRFGQTLQRVFPTSATVAARFDDRFRFVEVRWFDLGRRLVRVGVVRRGRDRWRTGGRATAAASSLAGRFPRGGRRLGRRDTADQKRGRGHVVIPSPSEFFRVAFAAARVPAPLGRQTTAARTLTREGDRQRPRQQLGQRDAGDLRSQTDNERPADQPPGAVIGSSWRSIDSLSKQSCTVVGGTTRSSLLTHPHLKWNRSPCPTANRIPRQSAPIREEPARSAKNWPRVAFLGASDGGGVAVKPVRLFRWLAMYRNRLLIGCCSATAISKFFDPLVPINSCVPAVQERRNQEQAG